MNFFTSYSLPSILLLSPQFHHRPQPLRSSSSRALSSSVKLVTPRGSLSLPIMSSPLLMDLIDERRPRHLWSLEDRQLLCLLSVRIDPLLFNIPLTTSQRTYENDIVDITAVLNSLLSDSLEADGYQKGLPPPTVQAQLQNMQRQGSSGHDVWRKMFLELSILDARRKYRAIREEIEDRAFALGISLRLKVENGQGVKHYARREVKKGRRDEKLKGVLDWVISSSDDDTDDEIMNRQRGRRVSRRKTKPRLLTPSSSRSRVSTSRNGSKGPWSDYSGGRATHVWEQVDELGNRTRRFPRLVYRWWSRQHQGVNTPTSIRAGKFLDANQVIPPPDWDEKAVNNHLASGMLPSPYISFRESLLPCLFAAIRANVDSWITVVDLQKVRHAPEQWGDDAFQVCAGLVKKYNLKLGKRGSYRGTGEWLVYGKCQYAVCSSSLMVI